MPTNIRIDNTNDNDSNNETKQSTQQQQSSSLPPQHTTTPQKVLIPVNSNMLDSNTLDTIRSVRSGSPVPVVSQTIDNSGYNTDTSTTSSNIQSSSSNANKPYKRYYSTVVQPDSFDIEKHFYPRVLNASLHPMVNSFMKLSNDIICKRYCHLHPLVDRNVLYKLLSKQANQFVWAGCDLFNVTNYSGSRQMIVIETNSSPSGQKSFPQQSGHEHHDCTGYHLLIQHDFKYRVDKLMNEHKLPDGGLCVLYDKNPMEATGYASAIAELFNEQCYLVQFYEDDLDPPAKFVDGVLYIRNKQNEWMSIRAAYRYVTQRPWCRIPVVTKTFIHNPIAACLAGGRNKMSADKAYELFNKEIAFGAGLAIRTPETIRDVSKHEIPMWISSMGGHAVIKNPYSNAGQGVYTITSNEELQHFMNEVHRYDKFIVQALVGNSTWSSSKIGSNDRRNHVYFHTGTVPNRKGETYVTDLRMMIISTSEGYRPIALYARRALNPLVEQLSDKDDSWAMLGTNLSVKREDGSWSSETERLLMMDNKDFNKLGLGIDDLIDAYIQTVMAAIAIDQLADKLMKDGKFDFQLYKSLNADDSLLKEIYNP